AGNWSQAQIDNWVNGIVTNINTALATVAPTGLKLVLFNVPDYGVTPFVRSIYTDPARRQLVTDVINLQLNPQIQALADQYDLTFVDGQGFVTAVYGSHASPNTTLSIGNVPIFLDQADTPSHTQPQAGAVHDGIHPHPAVAGGRRGLV